MSLDINIDVNIDSIEKPEGWVAISISPDRYAYRTSVRGVFPEADTDAQLAFIISTIPTVLNLARLQAEAQRLEREAEEAAEAAEVAKAAEEGVS